MMRMMLYEAAQVMLLRSAKWSWLKAWAMKIARHRGMKKAIVALARRFRPRVAREFERNGHFGPH
jgi:transposase